MLAQAIESPYFTTGTEAFSNEAEKISQNYKNAVWHLTRPVKSETPIEKFERLSASWKDDTRNSSSSKELLLHPAYLEIISMGKTVLPFIFHDLKSSSSHWFAALNIITGINPVTPDIRGNIQAIVNAWIEWGKQNRYVA